MNEAKKLFIDHKQSEFGEMMKNLLIRCAAGCQPGGACENVF